MSAIVQLQLTATYHLISRLEPFQNHHVALTVFAGFDEASLDRQLWFVPGIAFRLACLGLPGHHHVNRIAVKL